MFVAVTVGDKCSATSSTREKTNGDVARENYEHVSKSALAHDKTEQNVKRGFRKRTKLFMSKCKVSFYH